MRRLPASNFHYVGRSSHKPKAGDVFAMNVLGRFWLAGRVVVDDALESWPGSTPTRDGIIIYVYREGFSSPDEIRAPIAPLLVIPPENINPTGWRHGAFKHLFNAPLLLEERLKRHIFMYDDTGKYDGTGNNKYVNEYDEPVAPPAEGEIWGYEGLGSFRTVDALVSKALGIPEAPDEPLTGPKVALDSPKLAVPCTAAICVPTSPSAEDFFEDRAADVEDTLDDAMKRAGVGKWEGHGTDLTSGDMDIRFVGKDGRALAAALVDEIKARKLRLPRGWYITITPDDGGEPMRVTIPRK